MHRLAHLQHLTSLQVSYRLREGTVRIGGIPQLAFPPPAPGEDHRGLLSHLCHPFSVFYWQALAMYSTHPSRQGSHRPASPNPACVTKDRGLYLLMANTRQIFQILCERTHGLMHVPFGCANILQKSAGLRGELPSVHGQGKHLRCRRLLLVKQLCKCGCVLHTDSHPPHIAPRQGHLSQATHWSSLW